MSVHVCPVVRIGKTGKHPNADTLRIWNGPQGPIVFKEGTFAEDDLAAFVPLDSLVDCSRSEFNFLKADKEGSTTARVRPIKLRGKPSVGLLVSAPAGLNVGDDASAALGVTRYVPPPTHSFGTDSNAAKAPADVFGLSEYDVENVWNIDQFASLDGKITSESELTWDFSEKVHGCNARITRTEEGFHIGSKRRWVKFDSEKPSVWERAFRASIWNGEKSGQYMFDFQRLCEKYVLFGEVYGSVQDLHYGYPTDVRLIFFDLYDKKTHRFEEGNRVRWILNQYGLPAVPSLGRFTGKLSEAVELARNMLIEKPYSNIHAETIKEGIVIRPAHNDYMVNGNRGPTRLIVKAISDAYHQRKGGTDNAD